MAKWRREFGPLTCGAINVSFTFESGRRSANWVRSVNMCVAVVSTSRRGCFAVLIWRSEQSRSGGELPLDRDDLSFCCLAQPSSLILVPLS